MEGRPQWSVTNVRKIQFQYTKLPAIICALIKSRKPDIGLNIHIYAVAL